VCEGLRTEGVRIMKRLLLVGAEAHGVTFQAALGRPFGG
jgi:hypothetical protein